MADFSNNRVLQYYTPVFNTTANTVIGQPDFFSSAPNRGGAPAANTLSGPSSVALNTNGNLFVADFNNNRVLEYNSRQERQSLRGRFQ